MRMDNNVRKVDSIDSQKDDCIRTIKSKEGRMSVNLCVMLGECNCEGQNCCC